MSELVICDKDDLTLIANAIREQIGVLTTFNVPELTSTAVSLIEKSSSQSTLDILKDALSDCYEGWDDTNQFTPINGTSPNTIGTNLFYNSPFTTIYLPNVRITRDNYDSKIEYFSGSSNLKYLQLNYLSPVYINSVLSDTPIRAKKGVLILDPNDADLWSTTGIYANYTRTIIFRVSSSIYGDFSFSVNNLYFTLPNEILTWKDFIQSKYNTHGFYINDSTGRVKIADGSDIVREYTTQYGEPVYVLQDEAIGSFQYNTAEAESNEPT